MSTRDTGQVGCDYLSISINDAPAGELYANGRNQAKITVSYTLTDGNSGKPLSDDEQKRATVTLVHAVTGQDPAADGWQQSDKAGDFVSAADVLPGSMADTVVNGHIATQVLYLSHDAGSAKSVARLAPRVTYGSAVFDDVSNNQVHKGARITVSALPQIEYTLRNTTFTRYDGPGDGWHLDMDHYILTLAEDKAIDRFTYEAGGMYMAPAAFYFSESGGGAHAGGYSFWGLMWPMNSGETWFDPLKINIAPRNAKDVVCFTRVNIHDRGNYYPGPVLGSDTRFVIYDTYGNSGAFRISPANEGNTMELHSAS